MDCWKKLITIALFILYPLWATLGSEKWTAELTFNEIVNYAKNQTHTTWDYLEFISDLVKLDALSI